MARCLAVLSLLLILGLVLYPAWGGEDVKKSTEALLRDFSKLDANKDGRVNREEFLKLAKRFKDEPKARKKLATVYEQIDTDKKGITIEQFKTYLENYKKKTP